MALFDTLMSITNTASSAKSTYASAKTIASNSQPLPEDDKEENSEIAYIKEHGFKNALSKMSATERQALEKAIADAIEQKLNGATLVNQQNSGDETPSEHRDRMQAEIAFNPRMFDVFTSLQSELSDGSVQSITPDDKKEQDDAA